jgi:ATP-dependent RNA helicase RhlB
MKFETLEFHPDILKGIQDAGFVQCTPIQEQALPECMTGSDVIAQSQTGSGKTAVFLLTVFTRLLAAGPNTTGKPRALVMVPTRELATQVADDSEKLGKHLPFKTVAIYGGVEYNKQINALKEGVELVVATPGRMIDLYKSRQLSLDAIEIFVIDEADRMFDMGFAPDIMYIAGKLPKGKPRQTMLFSATIDENVRRLASRYMKPDPVMIEIEPEQVTVDLIDQKIIYVSNEEKLDVLITLLKRSEVERSIIFTNMKRTAEMLGVKLTGNGLPAKVLTGDITQDRRQKIIDGMKSGKIKTLVATDVAARGIHIDGITHVFNFDLPDDAANYVHRIGRTARAGKSGTAFSLVCEDHVLNLPEIEKYIERKLEPEWIEDSELVKDVAPAFHPKRRGGPSQQQGRGKGHEGRHKDKGFSKDRKGPERHARKIEAPEKAERPQGAEPMEKAGQPVEAAPGAPAIKEQGKEQRRRRDRGRGRGERGKNREKKEAAPNAAITASGEEPAAPEQKRPQRQAGQSEQPTRHNRPFERTRHHKGRKEGKPAPGHPAERPERHGSSARHSSDEKRHHQDRARHEKHEPKSHAHGAPAEEHRPKPHVHEAPAHVEKKEKTGLLKRVLKFLKKK